MSGPELLRAIFSEALARVAPAGPTARAVAELDRAGGLGDQVVLLATGKAALGMAEGADAALGARVVAREVVAPSLAGRPPRAGELEGSHPVPDGRSERAGRALLAAAAAARPEQQVLALVSGGGSALSAVPAPGLALADKAQTIARLAAAGAPIAELTCVRRHLSAIKGGRLALASRAPVTTLLVSDVVGDRMEEIASGPTVPDPTTFEDACAVIERRIGWDAVPAAARRHLEAGRRGERDEGLRALRPGDRATLVLGLGALVEAAEAAARARELEVEVLEERLEGEVGEVAERLLGARVASARSIFIAGGEPVVVLPARPGTGGRAQQLALLLARAIRGTDRVFLCAGSDGIDGASAAAGAVVDGATWDAIAAAGLDPADHLARCDAAPALAAAGAQITTGPTGVNHADLILALRTGSQRRRRRAARRAGGRAR
ncbi:MAG TPA: DUF4147 domain-containing protein [Kofleriaceae bacterium]|nr:DUF4147 domain-containing protein [Kofleriaceae bacterium]